MATEINRDSDPLLSAPKYATGSFGVTHIDYGLLLYFCADKGCRSMLDVGCGPGGQVRAAKDIGYRAMGIEVDPTFYREPSIALIDCCIAPFTLPAPADLVWSCEVAEHIPPDGVDYYLGTLAQNAGKVICMTASQQPGPLHLSVHPQAWWTDRMAALGWDLDPDTVSIINRYSTMEREFMRETGMIFRRNDR